RMLQLRIVVLSLADAPTPAANVPGPAASPPILKWLQSIVTLLVAMVMALPLLIAVDRLLRRHHVPWLSMVAGSESMNPAQVWKVSARALPGSRDRLPRTSIAASTWRRTGMWMFPLGVKRRHLVGGDQAYLQIARSGDGKG